MVSMYYQKYVKEKEELVVWRFALGPQHLQMVPAKPYRSELRLDFSL
jgi:hypothetical protein